jgi:glucose-6-phosphate 1-dehydrogenase
VPFLIRAGKCLPCSTTEVMVQFHRPPQVRLAGLSFAHARNYVRFRFSPNVETAIGARAKLPGERMQGQTVELDVDRHPTGDIDPYERLLTNAINGDGSLFARADSVEAAWHVVDPILTEPTPVYQYRPGTWGPPEADELIEAYGGWHNSCPPGAEP